MDSKGMSIDLHKINKFNVILIWIFIFVIIIQSFVVSGVDRGIIVTVTTLLTGIVVTAIVLLKVPVKFASIAIPFAPAIAITVLAITQNGSAGIFALYSVSAIMVALYFNKTSIVLYMLLIDLMFIVLYFILGIPLLGENFVVTDIMIQFVLLNIGGVILYFLTKWGNEYAQLAVQNEEKTKCVLADLQQTFQSVKLASEQLNQHIVDSRNYIKSTMESSNLISASMHDMAKGTEEESNAINNISIMMKDANEKLLLTSEQTLAIEAVSNEVNDIAVENERELINMKERMETIRVAVEQGFQTVSELGESMEQIVKFLSSITEIAEQTNLLSLNAAIEAARAGEAGKGFAIVADEIRKLSDQSNKTANEISQIVGELQQKADAAVYSSTKGNEATIDGSKGLDRLSESISKMIHSFEKMHSYTQEEVKSVKEMETLFFKIDELLEQNAAVLEEHSATTEQITVTVGEQNNKMIQMGEIIEKIELLSREMTELAKQNNESDGKSVESNK